MTLLYSNTCVYINLVDITPPRVTCPDDIFVSVDSGNSTIVDFIDATASDASGTTTLVEKTHESGSSFPVGVTNVTYTFVDGGGNSASCSFLVTVSTG